MHVGYTVTFILILFLSDWLFRKHSEFSITIGLKRRKWALGKARWSVGMWKQRPQRAEREKSREIDEDI